MNDKFKWVTGMSMAGFIAVFAMHGEAFFKAWMALPPLLRSFSGVLPYGLKSFALAAMLSALVYSTSVRRFEGRNGEFYAQMLSLLTGLGVALAQQFITDAPITPSTTLSAIWVGLLAGLGAPVGVRAMMAAPNLNTPPK